MSSAPVPPAPDSPASIGDLAKSLAGADVANHESQVVLHDLIQGYKRQLAARQAQLMGCMDAAASLVRSMGSLDAETARGVQDVAAGLLTLVSTASLRLQALDETPAPVPGHADASRDGLESTVSDEGIQTLNDMAMGELLIQLGIISQDQVDAAMEEMAATGRPFEDALYALGAIGPEDVFRAMKLQQALNSAQAPTDDPEQVAASLRRRRGLHAILLGEILVSMGRISRSQLEAALDHQRQNGVRIGEALVDLGFATWEDVAEAVRMQDQRGGSSERNTDATVINLDD